MTPLGTVALGLLLVLLDLRISGLDVVPDVLGWALAVGGLTRLGRLDGTFRRCRPWAVLSLVLSLADLVHPRVTTTTGDGFSSTSTTAAVAPNGLQGALVSGYGVASIGVAVLLCLAMRDRARRYGDVSMAQRFSLFLVLQVAAGVLVLVGWVLGLAAGVDGELRPEGGAAVVTLVLVLAALAMEVCFIATLHGARNRPWLQDVAPAVEDQALS